MAGSRPMTAFGAQNDLSVAEFKSHLTAAVNYAVPSAAKTKIYRKVRVLLASWIVDDLYVGNEVTRLRDVFKLTYNYACQVFKIPVSGPDTPRQALLNKISELMADTDERDLLIFYYAGHGAVGKGPGEGPCVFVSGPWNVTCPDGSIVQSNADLNFTDLKKATLDYARADVLYALDCCHATTAAINPGKELIAASTIEGGAGGPGYTSFTSCMVQELVHAGSTRQFLTAAQLYHTMLYKAYKGTLKYTPVHCETMVGPQPRSSIFLQPWVPAGTSLPAAQSTWPLTNSNLTPIGNHRSNVRVMLTVHLRDGTSETLDQMKQWVSNQRPTNVQKIGITFDFAASTNSLILFFSIPGAAWYSLRDHPAITFLGYTDSELPSGVENQPPSRGGQGKSGSGRSGTDGGKPGDHLGGRQGGEGGGGLSGSSGGATNIR
ncbi:MAG: hypothetical protein Q9208_005315 [Pyrenodesmia sp. 3 TL-2023]